MMKFSNRLLTLLLAVTMIFTVIPAVNVSADTPVDLIHDEDGIVRPGVYVTSFGGEFSSNATPLARVIDNSASTGNWVPDQNAVTAENPAWVQVNFPVAHVLTEVAVTGATSTWQNAAFSVRASNDVDFTESVLIGEKTPNWSYAAGEVITFSVADTNRYQYVRITPLDRASMGVTEIDIKGYEEDMPAPTDSLLTERTDVVASTSAEAYSDSYTPQHAIDGSNSTMSVSVLTAYPIFDIDLRREVEISQIRWLPRATNASPGIIKNFEVYVSKTGEFDGEEKLVYRRFDNSAPLTAENYTIVADGKSYRYVRFKSTSSTNVSFDVSEIKVYGTETTSSTVTNLANSATVTASSGANPTATNDGYISNSWKSAVGSTTADITYDFGDSPLATTSIMLFPIYEKVDSVENTEIRKNFNIYGSVDGTFSDKELIASVGDEAIKRGQYKVFDIEPKVYKAIKIEKSGTSTPVDMSGLGFREVKILNDTSKTEVKVVNYTPANDTNTDIVKADDTTTNYIEIELSKTPDMATVTPDTVKILDNGTAVDWKTGVDDAVTVEGNTAKISMKALNVNKTYTVVVTAGGVKTTNGLPLTETKTFSFTTNVNITVTGTFPANGNSVEIVNEDNSYNAVEVTFNKNLEETTVIPANITITDVTDGANNVVSVWDATVVDNKFSISTEYLAANKDYTLTISDGVKTKRNLSLTTAPYTLSFGTHVVVELLSNVPTNGQNIEFTNVDGTYNFVEATFNKNINSQSVNPTNVEIKNITDNEVVTEWEPVVAEKTVKVSTEYLAPNKSYTITFKQGGIKTLQNLPLTEEESFAFTTNVNVNVVSKTPNNGVSGITNIGNSNPFIEVELNRVPDVLSLTPDNVKIKTGSTTVTGWSATVSGNKFKIDISNLSSNKTYTVTLTKGITAGGCPLSSEQSFTFTTGTIINAPYKEGKIITNVALNKAVTGNLDSAYSSRFSHIVNGVIGSGDYTVTTTSGVRIQVDLQNVYDVVAFELHPSTQSVHSTLLQNLSVLGSKTDLDINNMSSEKSTSLILGSYPAGTTGSQMITLSAPESIRYVGLFRSATYCAIGELTVYAYADKDFGTWKVTKGEETMTGVADAGTYTFSVPVTNYETDADTDYYMIVSAYDENAALLYKNTGNVTAVKNTTSTLENSIDINDVSNVDTITAILVKSTSDGKSFIDAKTIYKTAPVSPESTEIPMTPATTLSDSIKFSVENDGFTMSGKAYENGYIKPTDRINLQVLEPKSDKTGYDFATISANDYVSKLCYAKTYGMFAEGEDFEFKFKVKDALAYGEYSIRLTLTKEDGTKETLNEYIVYLSDDDITSCITAFKNFTASDDMQALLNTWVTTKKYIGSSQLYQGLDITDVPDSFNKMFEYLCDIYIEEGSMTKISDVIDCLNGAYIISMFEANNATSASAALTTYPNVLKGMYDKDANVAKFIAVYSDLKSNIQDAESLEKVLCWSSALSYVQNGTRRDISDTITKNHTLMGCDLDYAATNGVTVDDVALKLVTNTVKASDYYDTFGQTFKDKVDEIVAERGNSGTSGSSSNKGNVSTYVPNTTSTVPSDEPKEDKEVQDEPENKYSFSDIENITWANEHIETLYKKGIVNGAGDGRFYPDRLVSREEFLKMLIEALEIGISDGLITEFEDCKSNEWYYPYVQIASSNKITNGIDRKNFGIGLSITREDMAVLISKSLAIKGVVGEKTDYAFKDENLISKYAADAVNMMHSLGLVNGFEDGTFGPKQGTTRAQAAVIIGRMLELVEGVTK